MSSLYGSGLYGAGLYGTGGAVGATGVRATATAVARFGALKGDIHVTGVRVTLTGRARPGSQLIAPPPVPLLNFPSLLVMLDITTEPSTTSRTWTNITAFVRDCSISRDGRSNETERTQTGSIGLLLDNRDGRFTPYNTSSPYYPGMKTTRWVQVQAIWQGVTYTRWTGLVDLIANEWPGIGKDSVVQLQGSSPLKVLNLAPLAGTAFPAQPSGARVTAVLRATHVAGGAIDTGSAQLDAFTPDAGDDVRGLPYLQQIEAEEQGIVFSDPSGFVRFHDRHHRFNATTVATIGDAAGELPYVNPTISNDDQFLFNSAHRSTAGTTDVEPVTMSAYDATSGTSHFARDNSASMLTQSTNEALAAAEAFVLRYKEPSLRVSQVDIVGANTPANWPTILNAANSNQYRFMRRYPGGGTISQLVFLEQVSERITPGPSWDTTWLLSPGTVDAYMSNRFWRVGSGTYGHLGTFAIGW